MKSSAPRILTVVMMALIAALAAGAASAAQDPILQSDKLVILSTTDVKGKTSPCG
jgi:hypothetical protein